MRTICLELMQTVSPLPGSYVFTVTGTGGGLTRMSTATLVVEAAPVPDFSLTTSPSSVTVTAGSPANYTVAITRLNGFTDAVDFVITGLPSGASGGFNPASTSGDSSALTVTTTGAPLPGSYVFTVTGTGGGLTRMSTATLVVEAAPVPDFSLSASPASQSVVQGVSTSYAVSIARSGGFIDAVNFTISGLPTDASGIFSPNDTTGDSSTLSVSTSTSTPRGSYLFTVTGMRGALTRTTTATLVVQKKKKTKN